MKQHLESAFIELSANQRLLTVFNQHSGFGCVFGANQSQCF